MRRRRALMNWTRSPGGFPVLQKRSAKFAGTPRIAISLRRAVSSA